MQQKIIQLQQQLAQGMIGRENIVKTALLAILAGENILLIGPPGTGKSMISRRLSEALAPQDNVSPYFEYLLTKFSTPEEIFGPLSISALKQDRFERHTAGYLPDVSLAFLDEIFKASSSILNSLLTILNERKFHNGTESQTVPLQALIAASNELPTGDTELAALYDRFLFRCFVDYLDDTSRAQLFQLTPALPIAPEQRLTADDIAHIQQQAQAVMVPQEVQQAMLNIWQQHALTFKERADEQLSDRRFAKAAHLLRISAATNGRTEADFSDVLLLKDCLWNHAEHRETVGELINQALRAFDRPIDAPAQSAPKPKAKTISTPPPTSHKIKGYRGSGTANDPLMISNLNELMGLQRPEIGQQGYHFRQTADIDGSAMDTWQDIIFQGTYDGAGHTITYRSNQTQALFKCINKNSNIHSLRLQHLSLACEVQGSTITCCQSQTFLVRDSINESQISDCVVCFDEDVQHYFCNKPSNTDRINHMEAITRLLDKNRTMGAITRLLDKNSTLERCLVYGNIQSVNQEKNDYYAYLSGMVAACRNSTIRQSVLGALTIPTRNFSTINRIVCKTEHATLQQNIALDSNQWEFDTNQISCTNKTANDFNSGDGKSVSAVLLNQHYYEHTLDWDFERIWQWNDATGYPELRQLPALAPDAAHQQSIHQKSSLLISQLQQNIWL